MGNDQELIQSNPTSHPQSLLDSKLDQKVVREILIVQVTITFRKKNDVEVIIGLRESQDC